MLPLPPSLAHPSLHLLSLCPHPPLLLHLQVVATPDIESFTLQPGDEFIVLACDGIWDVMSNQEVSGPW